VGLAALALIVIGFYVVYLIIPGVLAIFLVTSAGRLFLQVWPAVLLMLFMAIRSPGAALGKQRPPAV
jgi:hypothetical protein